MGFWHELRDIYDTPSRISSRGMYDLTKAWSGSDKNAAAGSRIGEVAGRAMMGDPLGFQTRVKGSDYGMDETKYRKGRQAGDWIGSIAGSYGIGSVFGGGGAAASEGAGAGGAGGFESMGLGDFLAAEGVGEGAGLAGSDIAGGTGAASSPWWQKLIKQMPKNQNTLGGQGSPLGNMLGSGGGTTASSNQWATPMAQPQQQMNPYTLAAILKAMEVPNGNV